MSLSTVTPARALVCLGDSITAASSARADRSYPAVLDALLFERDMQVANHGLGGAGYTTAQSYYTTYWKGRGLWGVCLLVGVNDIAAGTSVATTWAGISALVTEMTADGLYVVISTVTPWKNGGGWSAANQTKTEELNGYIRTLESNNTRVRVVDGYAEFGDADDPTLLRTSLQAAGELDSLHFGSLGCQQLAALFASGIVDILDAEAAPPNVTPSPGLGPDALAVQALREHLLRYLPAKVAQLNTLRAAALKSALVEPFTIPAGAVLRLSATSQEVAPTDVPLTSGVRTSAQVVADITAAAVPGLTASADEVGRVVLTADAAPAVGAPSVVVVARDSGRTGSNEALGWADGGEHYETAALVAPSWRGIVDGRPLTAPDLGQGFWLLLGNRTVRPTHPGIRRDTYNVTFQCEVWRPFSANAPPHRSRETISSCVRAVRELIEAGEGRYLGRYGAGDVQLATVTDVSISGEPLTFAEVPGVLFDFAKLTINVRVFQRPD